MISIDWQLSQNLPTDQVIVQAAAMSLIDIVLPFGLSISSG